MLKKLNQFLNLSIVSSILFLILGFCIMLLPVTFLTTICYIVAIGLIIHGLCLLFLDFKDKSPFFLTTILYEILSIILGVLILINPDAFKVILPIGLGIWFIISSILKLCLVFYTKEEGFGYFLLTLLLVIASIICGVILLMNPITSAVIITFTVGLLIVIYSITDLTEAIIFKIRWNSIKSKLKKEIDKAVERE